MELDEILTLIDHVSGSRLTSFSLEKEGVRLSMGRGDVRIEETEGIKPEAASAIPVSAIEESTGKEEKTLPPKGNIVKSPLVGTFYAAPAEDADPFVQVGDLVKKGQVLAIVEAMKLMNDIESEFEGQVAEIFVENGQPVEYGTPLFRIA